MSDLNPLLKHKKIGNAMGWDDFQNPTKDGIKKALEKESKKGRKVTIIHSLIMFSYGVLWFVNDIDSQLMKILAFTLIVGAPLTFISWKRNAVKSTNVSDEEIEEQLAIYEEWKETEN